MIWLAFAVLVWLNLSVARAAILHIDLCFRVGLADDPLGTLAELERVMLWRPSLAYFLLRDPMACYSERVRKLRGIEV